MSDDKLEGTVRNVGGKLEDAVGGLTGDGKTQMQGKLDQAAGIAQQMLGEAKQTVSGVADQVAATASDLGHDVHEKTADVIHRVGDRIQDNPFAVMIAAGLLGVAVGYFLGRPPQARAIQVGRARLAYRD